MHDQTTDLTWRDTDLGPVPVSTRFDDPYYSLDDGMAETRYVFLGGNDLPARFCDGFQIAELGFGTGLNFLTTLQAWNADPKGTFHFTSFEAFPITATEAAEALAAFPELADLATPLINAWGAAHAGPTMVTDTASLHVIVGDARETLPNWDKHADAWFLDGFSPAKNPELWGADLMQAVGDHTKPNGTVATYTAAGFVRCGLADAGFVITRETGFGRKRHMTVGRKSHAE